MIDKIALTIKSILLVGIITALMSTVLAAVPAFAIALLLPAVPLIHAAAATVITASLTFSIAGLLAGIAELVED